MMRSSHLQKVHPNVAEVRRRDGISYHVRDDAPTPSAPRKAQKQPSVDPDIELLIAASKSVSAEFDRAKASGNPNAIAVARAEVQTMAKKLESARVDALMRETMRLALRRPFRMGL